MKKCNHSCTVCASTCTSIDYSRVTVDNLKSFPITLLDRETFLSSINEKDPHIHRQDKKGKKMEVVEGVYIKSLFSYGNLKLSNNIAIWSLIEGLTCSNCDKCWEHCYARKSTRQYPSCFNSRLSKTYLALNDIERLERLITESSQT